MSSFYLPYLNSRIHAITEGEGPELLICLHGFGESAATFSKLEPAMGHLFTLVSLDLPLHGQTVWQEQRDFKPEDLVAIIRLILEQQQQTVFSLMGYSMGGRIALCVVERMAPQIRRLYLMAPDGLKVNFWHGLATQTFLGSRLFRYITYRPRFYFWLLDVGKRLGFVNESLYKFAHGSMNKPEKRILVYTVWICMRKMRPGRNRVKKLLGQYHIQTLLLFGKYDRVIPSSLGLRFMDGSFPCKMLILEKGHQLLSEELGETIIDNYE